MPRRIEKTKYGISYFTRKQRKRRGKEKQSLKAFQGLNNDRTEL